MSVKSETLLVVLLLVAGAAAYIYGGDKAVQKHVEPNLRRVNWPAWVGKYDVEFELGSGSSKSRSRSRAIGPCQVTNLKGDKKFKTSGKVYSDRKVPPVMLPDGLVLKQHSKFCEIIDKNGISCEYWHSYNVLYREGPICYQTRIKTF